MAKDIKSKINLPPFNNSAVDGYAILDKDIKTNNGLICKRRIAAGDDKSFKMSKGEVVRIFTGAKMPLNSRTVVMQENVKRTDNKIIVKKLPRVGENHRLKGEDIKINQVILKKNTNIDTTNLNLIAAIGIKKIPVFKKIKIGYYCGNLKDNFKIIEKKLSYNSKKFNLLITAGGASVGEEDYLINVIKKTGKILFWKAAIKPGRPIAFGKINNCYIICLPGNPVSVHLLYAFIVKPYIDYIAGAKFSLPMPEKIKVNFRMHKKTKWMEWLRVRKKKKNSEFILEKYPEQGSGMISSMAYSDGIIEIPEEVSQVKPGEFYHYYDFKILFL